MGAAPANIVDHDLAHMVDSMIAEADKNARLTLNRLYFPPTSEALTTESSQRPPAPAIPARVRSLGGFTVDVTAS